MIVFSLMLQRMIWEEISLNLMKGEIFYLIHTRKILREARGSNLELGKCFNICLKKVTY
jgi:hypothetical protein